MTKVYCSISKTVVFKNFVPKQDLNSFYYSQRSDALLRAYLFTPMDYIIWIIFGGLYNLDYII
jgi:hypothetical protein